MTVLSRPLLSNSLALAAMICLLFAGAQAADNPSDSKVKVDDNSFKCITEMTPVRHFYVDNLLGNVEATAAVAKAGKGDYPEGSVLQLMPNEVMIKHSKGFNPETRDWEFFYIDVDKNGSKIFRRGFTEVNNRLGGNCFACHRLNPSSISFASRTTDARRSRSRAPCSARCKGPIRAARMRSRSVQKTRKRSRSWAKSSNH